MRYYFPHESEPPGWMCRTRGHTWARYPSRWVRLAMLLGYKQTCGTCGAQRGR